jgi:hypothetical protein
LPLAKSFSASPCCHRRRGPLPHQKQFHCYCCYYCCN